MMTTHILLRWRHIGGVASQIADNSTIFFQTFVQAENKGISVLQALYDGDPPVTGGSPHKGPVMRKALSCNNVSWSWLVREGEIDDMLSTRWLSHYNVVCNTLFLFHQWQNSTLHFIGYVPLYWIYIYSTTKSSPWRWIKMNKLVRLPVCSGIGTKL